MVDASEQVKERTGAGALADGPAITQDAACRGGHVRRSAAQHQGAKHDQRPRPRREQPDKNTAEELQRASYRIDPGKAPCRRVGSLRTSVPPARHQSIKSR